MQLFGKQKKNKLKIAQKTRSYLWSMPGLNNSLMIKSKTSQMLLSTILGKPSTHALLSAIPQPFNLHLTYKKLGFSTMLYIDLHWSAHVLLLSVAMILAYILFLYDSVEKSIANTSTILIWCFMAAANRGTMVKFSTCAYLKLGVESTVQMETVS